MVRCNALNLSLRYSLYVQFPVHLPTGYSKVRQKLSCGFRVSKKNSLIPMDCNPESVPDDTVDWLISTPGLRSKLSRLVSVFSLGERVIQKVKCPIEFFLNVNIMNIRYDTLRYLTCSKNLTCSQIIPPHETN